MSALRPHLASPDAHAGASGPVAPPREDIGTYLGLTGRVPTAIYLLYALVFGATALTLGGPAMRTPLGLAALVLVLAAGVLFVIPGPTPFPVGRTVVVVLVVVATTAMITWQQPFHDHTPGYEAWEQGADAVLLFCLATRARILAAWVAEVAWIVAVCVWSTLVTGSPLYGIAMSYGQPIVLAAVTVFAVGLHRTARRILEYRAAERDRAAEETRQEVSERDREQELAVVRALAEPTLLRIAQADRPDPAEVRSLEAALRDHIRGRALLVEPLPSTLRTLRTRGVDVTVLDDLGDVEVPIEQLATAASWCVDRVGDMRGGVAALRIAPDADGVVVSVTRDGGAARELHLPGTRSESAPRPI